MPRGGARPGAGRPKGAKAKVPRGAVADYGAITTPKDYLLAVLRDPSADARRRDEAAKALLPYVHAKAARKATKPTFGNDTDGSGSQHGEDAEPRLSSKFAPGRPPRAAFGLPPPRTRDGEE